EQVDVLDLPGVNGFSARSLDEQVTRNALEGRIPGLKAPDALILIVDATRLESQLMLVEPVLTKGLPTLLVLNMADELSKRGGAIRDDVLAQELGVTVVRTDARNGVGVERVQQFLAEQARAALPASGNGAAVYVPPRRLELPVLGSYTERRKRIRAVGERASYTAPAPSM